MPEIYRNPSSAASPNLTTYLVPVGEGTVFEGREGLKAASFRDGMSKTVMVVEANDDQAVIWTQPDDWQYDPQEPLAGVGEAHPAGFIVLLADGSVEFIFDSIEHAVFRALLTVSGGEAVTDF